jgi:hypothetical protein
MGGMIRRSRNFGSLLSHTMSIISYRETLSIPVTKSNLRCESIFASSSMSLLEPSLVSSNKYRRFLFIVQLPVSSEFQSLNVSGTLKELQGS